LLSSGIAVGVAPSVVLVDMVHRPPDSRLLTNLLSQEKDYTKHLNALLDSSHSSQASFSVTQASTALSHDQFPSV
jgi:hypothetical protein